jgi:hypothetical protein
LCKGFNENEYLFSTIDSSEQIYKLDVNFALQHLKSLPYKSNATPGNDGYYYFASAGGKVFDDRYYLSIRTNSLSTTPPYGNRFMGLFVFNESLEQLQLINSGNEFDRNTVTSFTTNYLEDKFLVGTDKVLWFYQDNREFNTILVTKVNSLDTIVWELAYSDSFAYFPNSVKPLPNGGCIITGSRYLEGNTTFLDPFIMIVNEKGEVTSVENLPINTFSVYPNPSSTGFFTVNTTNRKKTKYVVTNLQGKNILEGEFTGEQNKIELPFTAVSGIYLITLQQENTIPITKRLVKL